MSRPAVILMVLFVAGVCRAIEQSPDRSAVYTAAQAAAGRIEIQKNSFGACTDCHATALGGRTGAAGEVPLFSSLPEDYQRLIQGNGGRVPDLVGPAFRTRWAGRTTKDLIAEFQL